MNKPVKAEKREEMEDLQKSEMSMGAIGAIVVASFIIGFVGVLMTSEVTDTVVYIVASVVSSIVVALVLLMVYGAVLANQDKQAQDERTAQAATKYLRTRDEL